MEVTPTSQDLFFSKNDAQDPRLGDLASSASLISVSSTDPCFFILGYPDDEGIRLNGGRPGAAEAPKSIRNFFYRMTPDASIKKSFSIKDLGDIQLNGDLRTRHERGRKIVGEILAIDGQWISLGGGHDYGYCDAVAFAEKFKDQKPLIVNFDAHLDVRPSEKNLNSGTPFYRLMKDHSSSCHFVEIGLQPQCNSPAHAQWLTERGGKILWQDILQKKGVLESLQPLVPLSPHPTFLSVDIDAFTSAIAPGCSQSWASGLQWHQFTEAFDFLIEAFDVRGIGIYEVAPSLDRDNQTSKLAALVMHRFIFNTLKKKSAL
jgi:formiminoglutamase